MLAITKFRKYVVFELSPQNTLKQSIEQVAKSLRAFIIFSIPLVSEFIDIGPQSLNDPKKLRMEFNNFPKFLSKERVIEQINEAGPLLLLLPETFSDECSRSLGYLHLVLESLTGLYFLDNLLKGLSRERQPPLKYLVIDDPDRPDIQLHGVGLLAQHLGRHVRGGAHDRVEFV
jgi:hypothetical protein